MDSRYVLGVVALCGLLLVVPAGPAADFVMLAISASAPVAVWYGARRFHPTTRQPWVLLGIGLAVIFLGDLLFAPASVPKDIVHVLGYVVIVAAALAMLRARGSGQDREGLLDAAIFGTGAAILMWHFVVVPEMTVAVDPTTRLFAVAYPLFDVVLFALIVRLLLSRGSRVASLWYLIGSLALALIVDVAGATAATVPLVDTASLLTRTLAAAAALSPTMCALTDPDTSERRHVQRLRLVALAGCLVLFGVFVAVDQLRAPAVRWDFVIGPPLFAVLIMLRLVLVVRDHERALALLSTQALFDVLTGLPNRRLVTDRIAVALARGLRSDAYTAVLFCDLDGFKHVNDRLGHTAGDEVLCRVADHLRSVLRPQDALGRLGGDEFLVCCEGVASPEAATAIAQRVVDAVARPLVVGGVVVSVSVSVGIAVARNSATADQLLHHADLAMYAAKAAGKNRLELYNERMSTLAEAERALATAPTQLEIATT